METKRHCASESCGSKTVQVKTYSDSGELVLRCGNCGLETALPKKRNTRKQAEIDAKLKEWGIEL